MSKKLFKKLMALNHVQLIVNNPEKKADKVNFENEERRSKKKNKPTNNKKLAKAANRV